MEEHENEIEQVAREFQRSQKVLLALGDENRQHLIPGFTVNKTLARASVEWVCACAADPACVLVAPNHDPDTAEQTMEF